MEAYIGKSLYIGKIETRFDMFDNVTLILKDGKEVSGEITDLEDGFVTLTNSSKITHIRVECIESYKA